MTFNANSIFATANRVILKKILLLGALLASYGVVTAQTLTANAGNDTTLCPSSNPPVNIGSNPTASGGTPPYTYAWTPNQNINSTTIANPSVSPTAPTWYVVVVVDAAGDTATDSVFINFHPAYAYGAGPDTSICDGDSIQLGEVANSMAGGVTYSWTPPTNISSTIAPRPLFTGTMTTTYTLTITVPGCASKQDIVTVTVNPLPVVDASGFAVIEEGQTTPLTATGATSYFWYPTNGLSNTTGALTNAEPLITTLYYVLGVDDNGCQDYDTVSVIVNPNDSLFFYNTFTPNNDGINDYFYIGNIQKYPDCRLEVFTRTGQQVYAKTAYDNSWDGTNYGDQLPETTYFYVLELGEGKPTYYGHVTIVR